MRDLDHVTELFPGVKVELRDTHTSQVIDALAEGKADIGIASGYHPLNGVTSEPLFSDRFGLIGASDHPLITQDKTLEIGDIDPSVFFRNALCDLIETPAFSQVLDRSDVTIQNTHSLITMVNTGRWVTVLPKTVAKFAPNTVSFRPIVDLPDKRQVYLYRRERTRFKDLTDTCFAFISSLDFD